MNVAAGDHSARRIPYSAIQALMQESMSSSTHYASYLLRLRWSQQEEEWVCQIMLTQVPTGERRYFADLPSFVAYLQQLEAGKGEEPLH
jgi:hypothetical protein